MMYHGREPAKIWWVSTWIESLCESCFFTEHKEMNVLMCHMFSCDSATCGMTHSPRCWLWQTSTLAAKFWCSRVALASCSELSWKEWGVRTFPWCLSVRPNDYNFFYNVFSFCAFLFVSSLYNYPLFPPHPGYGSVIQMYPGGEPGRAGVESFGFPAHFHDMLHGFPICHVNALLAGTLDTTAKDPSAGTASPLIKKTVSPRSL